jgi:polyribonucleotide nucleotidyltransferase
LLVPQTFECEVAGRRLVIESGRLAGQAEAAVTVRYGDTVVLVTVCIANEAREGVDFLPLTVDYEERLYAAGKIPGGFIRREGRPSTEATLACRMTDRPLRPLLPKTWRKEIQLIVTVMSADLENDADLLSIIGCSTVLGMSRVPFAGPVSAVCVGYVNGELILNPTLPQLGESDLDLVVASTKDNVVMIEAGANEVHEDIVLKGIQMGHEANQAIIKLQEAIWQALGKPKEEVPSGEADPAVFEAVSTKIGSRLVEALSNSDKTERDEAISALSKDVAEDMKDIDSGEIYSAIDKNVRNEIRKNILEKGIRISGRGITEIRPLSAEVSILPRTHGSGLFNRGKTQVMTITTLGSTRSEQRIDGLGIEETKRFIHHYNFPPFSTGEARRIGGTSRREIGHGALAEKSLQAVLPADEDFPYTIRLVSEVMSSNGSTSMASVCASSLSLMDAGIPIKRAVAGIAMGLITGEDGKWTVLTDIEGAEDNYGDMDFKVAGTSEGITGLQMDTKIKGLSSEIIAQTFKQAKEARLQILDVMNAVISEPRPNLSTYAPRVYKLTIPTEKIGAVIGPGGKTIRAIIDETKTTIDIDDSGTVLIGSSDEPSARRAIEIIQGMTKEIEVGQVYTGKVTRILNFGAMVEILPGKEGLVHISELADYRVGSVEDVVKVGDEIMVKAVEIDNLGRVNLSRKAVLEQATGGSGSSSSGSADYPFKSSRDSRPNQQRSQNFRNNRR